MHGLVLVTQVSGMAYGISTEIGFTRYSNPGSVLLGLPNKLYIYSSFYVLIIAFRLFWNLADWVLYVHNDNEK